MGLGLCILLEGELEVLSRLLMRNRGLPCRIAQLHKCAFGSLDLWLILFEEGGFSHQGWLLDLLFLLLIFILFRDLHDLDGFSAWIGSVKVCLWRLLALVLLTAVLLMTRFLLFLLVCPHQVELEALVLHLGLVHELLV